MSCRAPRSTVPTVDHKVRPGETLSSIAAQFDTTPSELCSLNRLSMRTVFADQVLRVPDPEVRAAHVAALEAAKKEEEEKLAAAKLASSPRAGPGLAARVLASPSPVSPSHALETPESVHERQFVKSEKAKLITWGEGVVSGVLIVTPRSLMFDPGYSDPLVREKGHLYFQIHIDLVEVISVSVYKDPRAMRLLAPAEMEDGDDGNSPSHDEMLLHLGLSESPNANKVSPSVEKEPDSSEKDRGSPPPKSPVPEVHEVVEEKNDDKGEVEEKEKENEEKEADKDGGEEKAEERREENALNSPSATEVLPNSAEGFVPRPSRHYDNAPVYMCIRHRPASGRNRTYKSTRTISASSTGSNNSGAAAIQGQEKEEERLPDRGQHWFSIPQENATELFDFLRRSGVSDQPKDDSSSSPLTRNSHGGVAPRPDSQSDASLNVFSLEDTGENDAFFVVHESHYGNSPRGTTPEMIAAVTENELSGSTDSKNIEKLRTIRQESLDWELISRSEAPSDSQMHAVCGIPPGGSFRQETLDEELPLPSLIGKTLMLSESRLRDLMRNLPTRAEGCLNMRLSYSTSQHGFSLATLYRRCKRDIEDRPCILLINSQGAPEDSCFGAILSHSMHFSDHYYGNGETRLVRWGPQLEISEWSGENNYILKGGCKTFMIGSSNGRVAVWLDEDLYRGRSQVCDTFNMREPLTHDGKEDFTIENLEVWTFH